MESPLFFVLGPFLAGYAGTCPGRVWLVLGKPEVMFFYFPLWKSSSKSVGSVLFPPPWFPWLVLMFPRPSSSHRRGDEVGSTPWGVLQNFNLPLVKLFFFFAAECPPPRFSANSFFQVGGVLTTSLRRRHAVPSFLVFRPVWRPCATLP